VCMRVAVLAAAAAVVLVLSATPASAHPGPVGSPPTELDRLVWSGHPVYCGGQRKRVFALTFDDGPGPWTEDLLAALRRGRAPATFFLVGNRVPLYQTSALAEAAEGAVGNHTWSHPELTLLNPPQVRRQLVWTQEELRRRLHVRTQLFRPPYEFANAKIERVVRALGLLDVRWNVDSLDSRAGARPGPVAREVVRNLKPGAIVLMHDTHPWTAKVVRTVFAAAHRKHLWPVTVPRLLEVDPPTPHENCYA
jgi:peptidoglycan/xylan/chitin deacetylase (PgdA/CDA1 family)